MFPDCCMPRNVSMATTQRLTLRHAGPLIWRGWLLPTASGGFAGFTARGGAGGRGCAIAGGEDVGEVGGSRRRWEVPHSDCCGVVGPGVRRGDGDGGLEVLCDMVVGG